MYPLRVRDGNLGLCLRRSLMDSTRLISVNVSRNGELLCCRVVIRIQAIPARVKVVPFPTIALSKIPNELTLMCVDCLLLRRLDRGLHRGDICIDNL